MSEMTATRTVLRLATLVVLAVGWAFAARALWATEVPGDLDLPRVSARDEFGAAELRRVARHDAFLRIDYLLALAAQLAAVGVIAWRAPRLAGRLPGSTLVRGLALGSIAFG